MIHYSKRLKVQSEFYSYLWHNKNKISHRRVFYSVARLFLYIFPQHTSTRRKIFYLHFPVFNKMFFPKLFIRNYLLKFYDVCQYFFNYFLANITHMDLFLKHFYRFSDKIFHNAIFSLFQYVKRFSSKHRWMLRK